MKLLACFLWWSLIEGEFDSDDWDSDGSKIDGEIELLRPGGGDDDGAAAGGGGGGGGGGRSSSSRSNSS